MKSADINHIATEIISKSSMLDRPYLVAIDGMSCAGKTTLSDSIAQILSESGLSVLRPSIDGFHNPKAVRYQQGEYSAKGYYEDTYNYNLIINDLLQPLTQGPWPVAVKTVSFDYRRDVPADETILAPQKSVLLFDGLFLMREELNRFWDYRILLDISFDEAIKRAIVRDEELLGGVDTVVKKYELRYNPAWMMYESIENPRSKANMMIDNNVIGEE